MSIYIQEVLGLLKRNKKKLKLDLIRDHFEFGKLYQNSSLNNAGTYGPKMEPFVIKWGDFICEATENLTRTQIGSGNVGYVPVYTNPEGSCSWDTIKDSIITQNAIADTITIGGKLKIVTVDQDDTLVQILVRDPGAGGEVKFRDASTIIPATGFDTLPMSTTADWTQTFLNAYVELDDTTIPYINIQGMVNLTDGVEGCVIAKNIKAGSVLADNVIRFPNGWGVVGNLFDNAVTWTPGIDNGYPTSTLLFGESIKMNYINYDIPGSTNNMLYWDGCCKTQPSGNACPVSSGQSVVIPEDTSTTGTLLTSDDGYGGYGLTFTLVTDIPAGEGTLTFDTVTGDWVYTFTAGFFGVTSFTWFVNDGYCDSAIATQTITVTATPDPPIWTSTDPVTANTYPNLTGGDVWTYNWTVADADTPCADLVFTTPSLPSWLTFTNNGNCTGTLTGTMPSGGGSFPVVLNVTDGTNSDSQTFTIAGLTITPNTYFQFWSDTSGSMQTQIRQIAQLSSVPLVYSRIIRTNTGTGTTTLNFGPTSLPCPTTCNNTSGRVSAADGLTAKAFYCVRPGMTAVGVGAAAARIPAGTTVVSVAVGGGGALGVKQGTAVLSNAHTLLVDDVVKFEITSAGMAADYTASSNFRNLFQDFYATGGTEASGNNNPATNGRDMYNSHIIWSHQDAEFQIAFFSGGQNGTPADGTNYLTYYPGAQAIQYLCFGDETTNYGMLPSQTGAGSWADRANTTVTEITTDVTTVKDYISNMVTAAGDNGIYRGIFFPLNFASSSVNTQISPLLGSQGLMATGGVSGNGFIYAPDAAAYNITTQTLYPESSGSPTYLTYTNTLSISGNDQYYYDQIQIALNNIGYSL
tara:strand:- start:11849 stop:14428 length:2580 start_codon:yes stop_codon:yes gene_type:complete